MNTFKITFNLLTRLHPELGVSVEALDLILNVYESVIQSVQQEPPPPLPPPSPLPSPPPPDSAYYNLDQPVIQLPTVTDTDSEDIPEVAQKYEFKTEEWYLNVMGGPSQDPKRFGRKFHLSKIDDIAKWRDWLEVVEDNNEYLSTRCHFLKKMCQNTQGLNGEEVLAVILPKIEKCKHAKLLGLAPTRQSLPKPTGEVEKMISEYQQKLRQGQEVITSYHVFGFILPPRRCEVQTLKIFDSEDLVGDNKNYYLKDCQTFVFGEFKTFSSFGVQRFDLNTDYPTVDPDLMEKLIVFMSKFSNGELFLKTGTGTPLKNMSRYFIQNLTLPIGDIRHYYATKYVATEHFKRICYQLAHSPGVSVTRYVNNLKTEE